MTIPSLGRYPRQGQAVSWVLYLLPCYTTRYREPPSKGSLAFPHLSPGDPSALQHRPSSPVRKETETRGLVQGCPALHCIIGHAAEQKQFPECPLLGPKRTGMSFEILHQHMPRSFQQCPMAALTSLRSLQLPFLGFPPLGFIYIGSKGMDMELREARGSSSAGGGDPKHSSSLSRRCQREQGMIPSLAGSGASRDQPLLLSSAPAKLSMFAQSESVCQVQSTTRSSPKGNGFVN